MRWLSDTEVSAAYGVGRAVVEAQTEAESRRRAIEELARLVPADLMTVDLVVLATGAVGHDAAPADAEPAGAFEAVVRRAADHPLLAAHATGRHRALRLSELVEPGALTHSELYGDLLHGSGVEYQIAISMRTGRGAAVVVALGRSEREFSERDRDVLDVAQPGLEGGLRAAQARERLARALVGDAPPGVAVVLLNDAGEIELSSLDGERWLAEHFGVAEHPGWLPRPIAEWLALPPRPPLVSERDGRRLTVCLLPGDPHALLLEEEVASFRSVALHRLSLTAREIEVLRAAAVMQDEADIAWELFLSLHAVRERLARLEAKLGVRTASDAVARALREST
jgi:DNA-binding CsgD family transcriptional regulator